MILSPLTQKELEGQWINLEVVEKLVFHPGCVMAYNFLRKRWSVVGGRWSVVGEEI
jgi:hypothetical protein